MPIPPTSSRCTKPRICLLTLYRAIATYDRLYWNAHRSFGRETSHYRPPVSTPIGVTDAFACIRRGDLQHTIRMSDVLGADRMNQQVGPYRIEVIDPLNELHYVRRQGTRIRTRPALAWIVPSG